MTSKLPRITQKRLRELMTYDQETGDFFWKVNPRGRLGKSISTPAGATRNLGYRLIRINYVAYYGHHLAWLYVHGEWPQYIDHRDGDPSNNRIDNLRLATHSQNMCNRKKERGNASGYKGVWRAKDSGKYWVDIGFCGKRSRRGPFLTAYEAHQAYCEMAARIHGEFARTK